MIGAPAGAAEKAASDTWARRTVVVAGTVFAMATLLFVFAYAASGFLLLFAGLLFAVFLDALTRGLGYVLDIPRPFRLAIVCLALVGAIALFAIGAGAMVVEQLPGLLDMLDRQARDLRARIEDLGLLGGEGEENGGGIASWIPDPSGVFGHATAAVATAFGVVGNFVIVVVLGLFLAVQPSLYHDGVVRLVPPAKRARFSAVLDEMGAILRFWLVGQALLMAIIGTVVWLALMVVGMPAAFLLGLIAGLLNFVPVIGPILAGIPILLVAFGQEWWHVFYALGVYTFIQMLEGNVLTPIIQQRAVSLPPALIFTAQILLGIMFGFFGLVLATPLAAAGKVAVERLYIEDVLGDGEEAG